MKSALITGVFGQDGYYLTRLLAGLGYRVVGLDRRVDEEFALALDDDARSRFEVRALDLVSAEGLPDLLAELGPTEIYHLAAQSNVGLSYVKPMETHLANGQGTLNLLEAVRSASPESRVFNAASADLFGEPAESPQSETTPLRPLSPYGCSKLYAFHLTRIYREQFGLFAASGILFNHESPRRPPAFVTRKISRAAARIRLGLEKSLSLGNLDAVRDWTFAGDTVRAMHLMLSAPAPDDYVIGSGTGRTVRDFLLAAFRAVGLDGASHVIVDPSLFRPADSRSKVADPSKARAELGWEPRTSFEELVETMVKADLEGEKARSGGGKKA
jgi:GDPmannose 4,6-dehydratase